VSAPHRMQPGLSAARGAVLMLSGRNGSANMLKIPTVNEVIVGELAERGEWIVATVQSNYPWPVNAQKVPYRGKSVWIIPIMDGYYPAVAVKAPDQKSRNEYERILMTFLSTLAWVEDQGFIVTEIGSGSLPAPVGRTEDGGISTCDEFDLSYFPEPTGQQAMLALALMREGRGLNHPGYAFLSFYRVLEVAFPNGRSRAQWVSDAIDRLRDHRAKEALERLRSTGIIDIGTHLYESGRCAIAHAAEEPIVDPDDPADTRRLQSELPTMMALAERAIEEELGVETSHTVWKKHLYELAGFKQILGPEIVDHLTRGEQLRDGIEIEIPDVSIRIRKRDSYKPFNRMQLDAIRQNGRVLHLRFVSTTGDVGIQVQLDFAEERLRFDLDTDLLATDTGSARAAEDMAEVSRFWMEYFMNGQLQVINAETGVLIARKDAYIPLNMSLNYEAAQAQVANWKHLGDGLAGARMLPFNQRGAKCRKYLLRPRGTTKSGASSGSQKWPKRKGQQC
jgi:hypothetical protein